MQGYDDAYFTRGDVWEQARRQKAEGRKQKPVFLFTKK
jgi:hypothetical protein